MLERYGKKENGGDPSRDVVNWLGLESVKPANARFEVFQMPGSE